MLFAFVGDFRNLFVKRRSRPFRAEDHLQRLWLVRWAHELTPTKLASKLYTCGADVIATFDVAAILIVFVVKQKNK
jgi:hypothetical protein